MTTWIEKTEQSEAWTEAAANRARVFSPLTFSLWPEFATGVSSDFWTEKTEQSETWTPA